MSGENTRRMSPFPPYQIVGGYNKDHCPALKQLLMPVPQSKRGHSSHPADQNGHGVCDDSALRLYRQLRIYMLIGRSM